MITTGPMRLPQPEPLDDLPAFLRGLEPDGGYWEAMRRLAAHDHSGGLMGVPVAGGGGEAGDVTLNGTEGLTAVEGPANTFTLGLTASPDSGNTAQVRTNGIYVPAPAPPALPPEVVTESELATALVPYATDADVAALQARVAALEAATPVDAALRAYVQQIMAVLDPGGPPPPPP